MLTLTKVEMGFLAALGFFFVGFAAGKYDKKTAVYPQPEVILSDEGTRIVKREVRPDLPPPIAMGAGVVESDTVVHVQSMMEPDKVTEIHFQEIRTLDGPRIVVEAPAGFRVVDATETRRGVASKGGGNRVMLGLASKVTREGAALGIGAGWDRGNWRFGATGFKDQVGLTALYRF